MRSALYETTAHTRRGSLDPSMNNEPDPLKLTPREAEVLGLMADGMTIHAIAAELGTSDSAVQGNVSVILERVGVGERTDTFRVSRPDEDTELRLELRRLPVADRLLLRRWLTADAAGRKSIASQILKRRTRSGAVMTRFIALLTTEPKQHERFTRIFKEIDAGGDWSVTNVIHGSLMCWGNSPAPRVGDSQGLPNEVTGANTGQCSNL
jgi:DNA-binding CsgD family transcriptional regulator